MPAQLDHRIGKDAKMYRNTGTHLIPVWVEMTRVSNVSQSLDKTKVDVPRRGTKYKYKGAGQIEGPLTFDYVYKPGTDVDFDALQDSFFNDTCFQVAVMDGNIATTGTEGFRAFMMVFSFPFDQGEETPQLFNVEMDLVAVDEGSGVIDPSWYVVP